MSTTHVCVAPSHVLQSFTGDAPQTKRFLRLPHPRTGLPALFLVDKDSTQPSGSKSASTILEVQAIAPEASRSWFSDDDNVVEDGKLLVFTPMDPLFLLLGVLSAASMLDQTRSGKFRPLDDIFEDACGKISEAQDAAAHGASPLITSDDIMLLAGLDCIQAAMGRCCDSKEITEDITVYRYSEAKLLDVLRAKVARVSDAANFNSFQSLVRGLAKDGLAVEPGDSKVALREAAQTRGACETIAHYLPSIVSEALVASYDFSALQKYLDSAAADEAAVRAEALSKESDAKDAKAAAKKKETTTKAGKGTRGVQQLSKANVQGMSKLSTFFTKKDKAK